MDRFFPNWPLKKKPSFAAYSRKESKWCRLCGENYGYVVKYLKCLFDEYEYRDASLHQSMAFLDWLEMDMPHFDLPLAGISNVVLPWKTIEPRFRRVDVVDGYRLQFMSLFEENDPFKAYGPCKRDIPEFVVNYFRLNING